MKNQGKIILLLSFALVAFAYFIWQVYSTNNRLRQTRTQVTRLTNIIQNIQELYSSIIASESAVRAYAITKNPVFEDEVNQLSAQINDNTAQTEALMRDSIAKKDFIELERLINTKMDFQFSVIEHGKNSPDQLRQDVASLRGKVLMDSIKVVINGIRTREIKLLQDRNEENKAVSQQALLTTIIGSIIFFLFIATILWRLSADMQRRINAEKELREFRFRFQGILDNTPLLIFLKDMQGRYMLVNKSFRETVKLTEEQLIGKTDFDFENRERAEQYKHSDEEIIRTLKPLEQEEIMTTAQGPSHLHYIKFPLLDENGQVFAISGFGSDITQRKQAEEKLRTSEAKMRALLDSTKEGFFLLDQNLNFLLMNEAGKKMMQLVTGKTIAVGESLLKLVSEHRKEPVIEIMQDVLKNCKTIEFERSFDTPQGEKWLLLNYLPVEFRDTQARGVSIVARDITELARYREQLIEARKKAERAEKLQEQFLANMSHEIRTPLNGVTGMTNLLLQTKLTEDQLEYVNIVKYSSDNLSVLINDILDFSKIKAGKLSIENIEFNLWEVAQKAVASLQTRAKEKDLGVLIFFHTDTPSRIKGDPHRLNQILSNLLGNAIKFTQQGYVRLEIAVASEVDNNVRLQFQVKDSGIGIPEDKLAYIFESFSQAGEEITRKYGGTGLGLTITKQLIELQNGCIDIHSQAGAGTTISFEIPYERIQVGDHEPTEEEEITDRNAALANKKILIVEDNEVNQKVIAYNLEPAGVITTIAVNGREAVDKLEAGEKFDLIIMDLQMPVMNGFQATAYIRQKLHLNTPIIAMTASALRNEQVKCFELGMNEYVTKPFAPSELFRLLERHVSGGGNGKKKNNDNNGENTQPYSLENISIKKKKDVIAHVLNIFLTETPPMLQQVKDHILHEHWDETFSKAHKLKSSVGLLQMNELLHTITLIEQNAKNRENLDDLPALIDTAMEQYNLIQPMLQAELAAASS